MELKSIEPRLILDDKDYQSWLERIEDYTPVLLQSFIPPKKSCLSWPIELWKFQRGCIKGNKYFAHSAHDDQPINRETGIRQYWNSDNEYGEVFPVRVIPYEDPYRDKFLLRPGDFCWGDRPIYEPNYYGHYRHVYGVGYGPGYSKTKPRKLFNRYYSYEVTNGFVVHGFSETYPEEMPREFNGMKYLYSEELQR